MNIAWRPLWYFLAFLSNPVAEVPSSRQELEATQRYGRAIVSEIRGRLGTGESRLIRFFRLSIGGIVFLKTNLIYRIVNRCYL